MHRLEAARLLDSFGDFSDPAGGRIGNREDRRGLSFGFVDLLLFLSFRGFNRLLLLAFRAVDGGVSLAFRSQDQRAFFALGAHLFFHRGENILRRRKAA